MTRKIKDLPAPKLVIFDCDGVLLNSWESTCYFYNRIRENLGLSRLSSEEEQYVFVSTVDEGLKRVIPSELQGPAHELVNAFPWEEIVPLIQTEPEIEDFLLFLREHGIKTAVNTNGGKENRMILRTKGLMRLFDKVVTADDVAKPKPDPEGVRRILGDFGILKEEMLFIGDSIVDQKTARAAGVLFGAYKNPSLQADIYIDSFSWLTGWLIGWLGLNGGIFLSRSWDFIGYPSTVRN